MSTSIVLSAFLFGGKMRPFKNINDSSNPRPFSRTWGVHSRNKQYLLQFISCCFFREMNVTLQWQKRKSCVGGNMLNFQMPVGPYGIWPRNKIFTGITLPAPLHHSARARLLLLVGRAGVLLCSLNGLFCIENILNITQP